MRAEATAKKQPAPARATTLRADPITQKVVNNALQGVAEQMAATILRTSYSTVVREMLDYSTAVFDPKGQIISQSCRIPIHLNSMSRSLRTTIEQVIPLDQWKPGDIIVTNDPYLGGQHIPDVQTFLPVFADGKVVAICGTLDHHLDMGGMRPASYAVHHARTKRAMARGLVPPGRPWRFWPELNFSVPGKRNRPLHCLSHSRTNQGRWPPG